MRLPLAPLPRRSALPPVTGLASLLLLGVCVAAATAGVAGCRRGDAPARSGAAGDGAGGRPPTGKTLRIAMIGKSSLNPSFLSARIGAEVRARELALQLGSPIEIVWLTPSHDQGQVQAQRILQAVNDRVDAILISCSDDQKVSRAIDDAVARGVAVMTFDSDAPRSRRFAFCGVDDHEVGRKLVMEMAGLLEPAAAGRPGRGKKARPPLFQVAILAGSEAAPNLRRRLEGAIEEAARHPHLHILGTFFHPETSREASATVLRTTAAHPELAGWVMLGGWPLYNQTLLRELQRSAPDAAGAGSAGAPSDKQDVPAPPYKIVAVNALPPQLIYVEKGWAPVLLAQPTYLWGSVGVESIVKKLLTQQPVPEQIRLELIRVTAGNLGTWARQLKTWGFGDVPDEYLRLK